MLECSEYIVHKIIMSIHSTPEKEQKQIYRSVTFFLTREQDQKKACSEVAKLEQAKGSSLVTTQGRSSSSAATAAALVHVVEEPTTSFNH